GRGREHRARPSRRLMIRALLLLLAVFSLSVSAAVPKPPSVVGKAWMVGDLTGGQLLASYKPEERFEPASLTKLMTAYVVFSALRERKLSLEQRVNVSPRAVKAPGGRMFLDPRRPVTIDELIRGMVVQSANDGCIVPAGAGAGSEDAFARLRNREAARLGLKNPRFMNATGLPDAQH